MPVRVYVHLSYSVPPVFGRLVAAPTVHKMFTHAIVVTLSHDDCTSYNSMNKFQKCAVGAVRRAANQNPTIAGGNRTITLSAIRRPSCIGIELLYGIGGHLRGFPAAAGKHHGRCHNLARHQGNHGRAHIAVSPPTRSRDSRRLPSSRTPIREIRRSTSPFMSALSHSRRIPTTAHL